MRSSSKPENNRGNFTDRNPKNRGYDPEIFTVSTERKEIALLPGIGRFCEAGCGRPIKGKLVKHMIHGKPVEIFHKPRYDQRFCSENCKHKINNKKHPTDWDKIRINCSLMLRVESNEKIPYRLLKLHLKSQNDTIDIRITEKNNPEIWRICEKVARYRTDPIKIDASKTGVNLLSC